MRMFRSRLDGEVRKRNTTVSSENLVMDEQEKGISILRTIKIVKCAALLYCIVQTPVRTLSSFVECGTVNLTGQDQDIEEE